MAIRYSADAQLDLLTIDGAGGGTGMSPWNMMQNWGIPSLALHAKTYEYCEILFKKSHQGTGYLSGRRLARGGSSFQGPVTCVTICKIGFVLSCPDDSRLPWQ